MISLWGEIREYIGAEINLGIQRHVNETEPAHINTEKVRELEEQSSRMETAIRTRLENIDASMRRLDATLTELDANNVGPYGYKSEPCLICDCKDDDTCREQPGCRRIANATCVRSA